MKIDSTSKISPATTVGPEERARTEKRQDNASAPARGEVQISPLSTQLKEIEASLESTEVVNSERVAEVKRAIAEGRFEVNAEKVADRLIEATRERLQAHKQ